MSALYLVNILVVVVAAWAVWERRLAFGSRWDAPITWGIALFGAGAALDSPWPGVAAASFPLTGRYYLLMVMAHFCYLAGAAMGIRSVYLRLLPDGAIDGFMRAKMLTPIALASAVMVVCVLASPISTTMPADHLYLVRPDGWMAAYWVAFLGALGALEMVSMYGLNLLRGDQRSAMVGLLIASQAVGTLAIGCIGVAVLSGRGGVAQTLVWPFAYAGIIGGSIAAVVSWRFRVRSLVS